MVAPRKYTDEALAKAVPEALSVAQVLQAIGLRPAGGNYKTVQVRIEELGLDCSHFRRQAWSKGKKIPRDALLSLAEILVEGSHYQSNKLRQRLLSEGLKKPQCESCLLTTWNGKSIPLELEHVNGNSNDNRLENLKIFCPNCHAQTVSYRGRNIGRASRPRTPTGRERALKPPTV